MRLDALVMNRILEDLVEDGMIYGESGEDIAGVESVSTFAEAGILTRDAGLVVRLFNGAEFQLSIVTSARPHSGVECAECGAFFGGDESDITLAYTDHLVSEHSWHHVDAEEHAVAEAHYHGRS